jgi:hypothetical protein
VETFALIFTAVSCSAGATWVIHGAISKLSQALAVHVEEDKAMHARVIQIESKQKRARR